MTLDDIKEKISSGFEKAEINLTGDGCNCSATVISDEFLNMSLLQRQRKVLHTVKEEIASGELHALSVKTYTLKEKSKLKS